MDNKEYILSLLDTIEDHFKTVTVPSFIHHKCFYRGDDGAKCAVGVLIDDEHYHPGLDAGKSVLDSAVQQALVNSGIRDDAVVFNFLQRVQVRHDSTASACRDEIEQWQPRFMAELDHMRDGLNEGIL